MANSPALVTTVIEDFAEDQERFFGEEWQDIAFAASDLEPVETVTVTIPADVAREFGLGDAGVTSTYKVVDLRGKIPGSPVANQGTQAKTGGTVIHYNGPATGVPAGRISAVQLLYNDASYHMRVNWGRGARANGIQYHYAVWGDTLYILRNPNSILWHCGAWPQNGSATAVNVPIGAGERATPQTIRTLAAFVTNENTRQKRTHRNTYSHHELSATACCGSLITDFVRPFRAGTLKATPPPIEPKKWNFLYHENAPWAKERAEFLARELGASAQAVGEVRKVDYLANYCLDYPTAGVHVAVLVGRQVLEFVGDAPEQAMREYAKDICDVWDGLTEAGMLECVAEIQKRTNSANLLDRYRKSFGAAKPAPEPKDPKTPRWEIPATADPTKEAEVTRSGEVVGGYAPKG